MRSCWCVLCTNTHTSISSQLGITVCIHAQLNLDRGTPVHLARLANDDHLCSLAIAVGVVASVRAPIPIRRLHTRADALPTHHTHTILLFRVLNINSSSFDTVLFSMVLHHALEGRRPSIWSPLDDLADAHWRCNTPRFAVSRGCIWGPGERGDVTDTAGGKWVMCASDEEWRAVGVNG